MSKITFVSPDDTMRTTIVLLMQEREAEVRERLEQDRGARRAHWWGFHPDALLNEITAMEAALCMVTEREIRGSVKERYAGVGKADLVHELLNLEVETRATCEARWRALETQCALTARAPGGHQLFTVDEFLELPGAVRKMYVGKLLRSVTPEQVETELERASTTPWW